MAEKIDHLFTVVHPAKGELDPFSLDTDRVRRVLPLLTYCDLTTSPDGEPITVDHRAITHGEADLRAIVESVEAAGAPTKIPRQLEQRAPKIRRSRASAG